MQSICKIDNNYFPEPSSSMRAHFELIILSWNAMQVFRYNQYGTYKNSDGALQRYQFIFNCEEALVNLISIWREKMAKIAVRSFFKNNFEKFLKIRNLTNFFRSFLLSLLSWLLSKEHPHHLRFQHRLRSLLHCLTLKQRLILKPKFTTHQFTPTTMDTTLITVSLGK